MNKLQKEYVTVCGRLNDNIGEGNSGRSDTNLPKLKLPEFNGTGSWRNFKELFDEIVHNNKKLSDKAKAQYLKTVLTGEAATVVSCLAANENNYCEIYASLIQRYDNKRKTVNELIKKITNIPKMTYMNRALR